MWNHNIKKYLYNAIAVLMVCLFTSDVATQDVGIGSFHTPIVKGLQFSDKLAIPIMNSNILPQSEEDKKIIKMAMRASLRFLTRQRSGLLKEGKLDIDAIVKRATTEIISNASNYPGLQFFMHESIGNNTIMCRLRDSSGEKPRTYYVAVSLNDDPEDSVWVDVIDQNAFEKGSDLNNSVMVPSVEPKELKTERQLEVAGHNEEERVLEKSAFAGYLREEVVIDVPKAEERLNGLEIPLAVGLFIETPYAMQRLLDHLHIARQRLPANVKISNVWVITQSSDVREKAINMKRKLETFGFDVDILFSEDSDYSDCMYQLENAALEAGARAVALMNGAIDYPPEHLAQSLRALLSLSDPSVIVSHLDKIRKVSEVQNKPVDFMFWTDPDYVKYRVKGKSWLDSVWPYLVSSSRVNKDYHVHSGIGDIEQVSIGGHREKWKASHFDSYRLESLNDFISEEYPGEVDYLLPVDETVLFIEPHQDDFVLRASGLLQRLFNRGNHMRVLHFEVGKGTENNYHWPPHLEYRDKENQDAFERLGVPMDTESVLIPDNTAGDVEAEISLFEQKIGKSESNIIVIPGSCDTHRHHSRIRYLALAAAQRLANSTGRPFRIISVPLFSSASQGIEKVNCVTCLSASEEEARRDALGAYGSQKEYVSGPLFESRQKVMQETLYGLTGSDIKRDQGYLEGFENQLVRPVQILNKGDLALQIVRNESLTVSFRENNRIFAFTFQKNSKDVTVTIDGQEIERMTLREYITLNHFTASLLTLVSERDSQRGHVSVREIEGSSGRQNIIDWMIEAGELVSTGKNRENLASAYRESYERIIGKIENIKMSQTWFLEGSRRTKEKELSQNEVLYRQRIQKPKKFMIGIATHDSAELVGNRLANIRGQLMELPDYCQSWQIEVVLYSNARPGDVDDMTDAMIEQIPGTFFEGLPFRTTLVVKKEPFPNQANSIHQLYRYAKQNDVDMILFTDDDVDYEPGAIRVMLDRLLRSEGPTFVSGRFYWRARSDEVLREEAEWELSENAVFSHLPSKVQEQIIFMKVFYKKQWQEIARFRRRPDIPFSPRVAMGAGLLMWTDHYAGFPYWFPQADVVQRYRFFPFIDIVEDARMSSVAARSFSYLIKKAPRTIGGWREQINKVFSRERRLLQRDGDVYYGRDILFAMWMKLSLPDKFYSVANLGLVALARSLSHIIPQGRNAQPNADERGADVALIDKEDAFLNRIGGQIPSDWEELRMDADQLTLVKKNGKGQVFKAQKELCGFHDSLLNFFEQVEVDSKHWPLVQQKTLEGLCKLYSEEFGTSSTVNLRNLLRVFIVYYAVPDVRAEDIMERLNVKRDELLDIYETIREQPALQKLFEEHPTGRHYFSWLRTLIERSDHTASIIDNDPVFPVSVEIHPSITCNLKCKFCYNRNGLYYEEQLRGESKLTPDEWRSLVREMAEKGVRRIDLVGGLEPFKNKEASLAIMDEAQRFGIKLRIFTNGYELRPDNKDIIKRLLYQNVERVDISLRGGKAETHRDIVGGKDLNDFQKLRENIENLAHERDRTGSSMKISVNFVLIPDNFRELPEMFQLVDDVNADIIGLGTNNVAGRDQLDLNRLEQQELAQLLLDEKKKMKDGRRSYDVATNESIDRMITEFEHYGHLPAVYRYSFGLPKTCNSFLFRPIINPFGNVFKCCLVGQPMIALPIGYMGQVVRGGKSFEDVIRTTSSHSFHDCPSCNPAERTGLAVIEKLADDQKQGIPLDKQPIQFAKVFGKEDGAIRYYQEKAVKIQEYADRTEGRLPMPSFDIQKMMSKGDVDLNLLKLNLKERGRYWRRAIDYLRELKEKDGRICINISMGGASSRMRKGPLPQILIEAMQADPGSFVDPFIFSDQEQQIIRDKYQDNFHLFIEDLDPGREADLAVLNRVIYASKAFLPAGQSNSGQWYGLDEYGLRNISAANEELEKLGLGRPFVAIVATSNELYQVCVERCVRKDFFGLKVSTIQNKDGHIDIDHDDLTNELLFYTDNSGHRIIPPVSVVDRERDNTGLFPSQEAYEYARRFAIDNGGKIITDRSPVGKGGVEFLAMLETSKMSRKRPLLEELIQRRIEYGFGRTVDNMSMLNEDWMTTLGFMLDRKLSLAFEVSDRPAGETGSFFAWIKNRAADGQLQKEKRLISFDVLMASLSQKGTLEDMLGDTPINNGAWYFRFPTPDNVDLREDVFSANLLPELQDDFSAVVKQVRRGEVTPESFRMFFEDLQKRNDQTPILRTIKNPYLPAPGDNQLILTVVLEYSEQSEQDQLLDRTGVVLVPSIQDTSGLTEGPGVDFSAVRFNPLKKRATYENDTAQRVREALLKRVVDGPLFSREFTETVVSCLKEELPSVPEQDNSHTEIAIEVGQQKRSIDDAKNTGIMIPTNTYDGRYKLLVSSNIGTQVELEKDRWSHSLDGITRSDIPTDNIGYGDRFDLDMINTDSMDNIIRHVEMLLAGTSLDRKVLRSDQIIIQADYVFSTEDISRLKAIAPDIRILCINTVGLKSVGDAQQRREYRFNIYAMMMVARKITKTDRDNVIYRTLEFYLKTHYGNGEQDIVVDFIEALTNGELEKVMGYAFAFHPADKWDTEALQLVTKALISA